MRPVKIYNEGKIVDLLAGPWSMDPAGAMISGKVTTAGKVIGARAVSSGHYVSRAMHIHTVEPSQLRDTGPSLPCKLGTMGWREELSEILISLWRWRMTFLDLPQKNYSLSAFNSALLRSSSSLLIAFSHGRSREERRSHANTSSEGSPQQLQFRRDHFLGPRKACGRLLFKGTPKWPYFRRLK